MYQGVRKERKTIFSVDTMEETDLEKEITTSLFLDTPWKIELERIERNTLATLRNTLATLLLET